jgi:hypothetical protein
MPDTPLSSLPGAVYLYGIECHFRPLREFVVDASD